ncbi:MAG: chemotaxis response regulator protein-glutamate methylesterase [Gemmatimonadetes bacterium]|uniref:Protein-glutamate methylesterase/protein-glutamine glutaminase n=1 Tax=Candidatus Kutchimonas denitrificans TaxID=3056748 RepID=A0AAE5CBK4_9BACT|nr:chemotaxis response regulator protein-glutamate methylesterase [Gemmatimonadota bacterium]NIR74535.1 chemotaxis response regulator protein-glutamate methylesterase [Candidatus Kutchimonas denitrificans]NIS02725.1 chemotaxis response regulator protein-glutamate methylesterase [Gemmatimonadota bacterium]NIT68886.1 chemotaxis response regulator protein-glutamate methylesterase [Gemmatimonadota bacterium]NIU52191.1 chemotaxis-specific protein-glutamate methyltransferase CheB [Gemmatimonadota bac
MSRSESGSIRSVLVVDDSIFMRRMISDMIERFPGYRVVATAADGEEALRLIERHDPDLVTLDIEMPRLDGFGVLKRVMGSRPRPCVVLSAYTATGSEAALRALELGAVEFVAKPSGPISFDVAKVEGHLFEALEAAAAADLDALLEERRGEITRPVALAVEGEESVVVIAASTGGPRALSFLLGTLPASLEAAVLVVQHMPAGFTATLAARLDGVSKLPVTEATGGETVVANHVWLAPGNFHMRLRRFEREVRIVLDQREPLRGTRPAADALFPTAAALYGKRCIGVVLTGMGRDGADGLAAIRAASGRTIVQDEATSVVFGMPGRAIAQGAAEQVVPLDRVPEAIVECLSAIAERGRDTTT